MHAQYYYFINYKIAQTFSLERQHLFTISLCYIVVITNTHDSKIITHEIFTVNYLRYLKLR